MGEIATHLVNIDITRELHPPPSMLVTGSELGIVIALLQRVCMECVKRQCSYLFYDQSPLDPGSLVNDNILEKFDIKMFFSMKPSHYDNL